ncbi:DUF6233 domain-containing protein [Streptomyces sp. BE133]|uniref:DUF6233 domain-containing protein n=1 Tax=Streptomyces sp. BE133 TaxID=3002523 RepID=UPI002E7A0858|nr:DUF6233 domain-containing protein [Streptomyces sp. BE133]MEE1808116.1 DUF6233 domain-containing protein [Streptomyces sp. BE133]
MPGGDISDLDKNRALVDWLRYQLRQAENRVRELEVKELQEQRARERARAEQSWKIQPKRSGETAMLHRGGCSLYSAQLGFINRQEAIIALDEPDIEACQICKPETGLVDG